jgi:hypothetical protein
MLAIWIVATVIQFAIAIARKPKLAKRGPGELDGPQAEQGLPIPVVFGTVRAKGPNIVWWGNYEYKGKMDDQIYDHWAIVNMAICHGPVDRIRRIWYGETLARTIVKTPRGGGAPPASANNIGVTEIATSVNFPNYSPSEGASWVVGSGWNAQWVSEIQGTQLESLRPSILGWFAVFRSGQWTYVRPSGLVLLDGVLKEWSGIAWVAPSVSTSTPLVMISDHHAQQESMKLGGHVEFWHGAPGQGVSGVLKAFARNNGTAPAYEGLCHAVFSFGSPKAQQIGNVTYTNHKIGFYWGESPIIPQVSFEVERLPNLLGMGSASLTSWTNMRPKQADSGVLAKATSHRCNIGDATPAGRNGDYAYDANPAEIVLEILTNSDWGMGIPLAMVDLESFRDCAKILHAEAFGMSMLLDQQSEADDVLGDVLKTVDGAYYRDPATGLHTMRLIRQLYTEAQATAMGIGTWYWNPPIITLTEDDVIGDLEYSRGTMSDVANEVKVQYTDRFDDYATRVVQAQDDANYSAMGEVVSISNTYNGVMTRELALRLAARDLKFYGSPLARAKGEFKRRARVLRPGDRFILDYSQTLGIAAMQFRVGQIRYGTMDDRRVAIEAVEDVFAMADTTYTEPGSGWIDPSNVEPVAPAAQRAWELPYTMAPKIENKSGGWTNDLTGLAARGNQYTTDLTLVPVTDSVYLPENSLAIRYAPSSLLTAPLVIEERTASIALQGCVDFGGFDPDGSAGSGRNLLLVDDELISFQGFTHDPLTGTATLTGCLRGVVDTIPAEHALASRVWLVRDPIPASSGGMYGAPMTADHDVRFSLVAGNSMAQLDMLGQPIIGGMTTSRIYRPYVPGKFRVNGAGDLPASLVDQIVTGDVPVAWESRNRISQGPFVVAQDTVGISGETNQLQRLALVKGLGLAFRPELPWGGDFPFGEAVQYSGQPANWINLRDTIWLDAVGIKDYGDWQVGAPGFSATMYLYISIDGAQYSNDHNSGPWTYGYDYSGLYSGRVYLFRAVFVMAGGNISVTLYDLRGVVQEAVLVNSPSATSGTIATQDVVDIGLNGLHPNRAVVDSHRDGLDSMEKRESGFLFDAGWGMAWGLHWGATTTTEDTIGWGWDWGNNWGGA